MGIPYIGFGNNELDQLPKANVGQLIECLRCGKDHILKAGTCDGKPSDLVLFYKCGGKLYLGAVGGKLVNNVKPSCSGEI